MREKYTYLSDLVQHSPSCYILCFLLVAGYAQTCHPVEEHLVQYIIYSLLVGTPYLVTVGRSVGGPSCTNQIDHESVVPELRLRLRPFLEEPLRIPIVRLGYWSPGHHATLVARGYCYLEQKWLTRGKILRARINMIDLIT